MVHRNVSLCFFKITKNLLFCLPSIEDEMITGKVFSSPKNVHFQVLGNGLSSSFGGVSNDRLSFLPNGVSYSILAFHLLVSIDGNESSKALTSSINLSISKVNQK